MLKKLVVSVVDKCNNCPMCQIDRDYVNLHCKALNGKIIGESREVIERGIIPKWCPFPDVDKSKTLTEYIEKLTL